RIAAENVVDIAYFDIDDLRAGQCNLRHIDEVSEIRGALIDHAIAEAGRFHRCHVEVDRVWIVQRDRPGSHPFRIDEFNAEWLQLSASRGRHTRFPRGSAQVLVVESTVAPSGVVKRNSYSRISIRPSLRLG